ncbi:MAG TPA: dehydrogenase [Cyanobacteria bacterium UBA11149]|nr:dehydrogenase [Cyanobacteria bacterium UBA11367]HBE57915.1 dehydrogenase [Cyanobacteria bacterium UBA11366]HBK66461.1 dehydrogenase [Cyanobacteria bacterium UBA11166]HBR74830.1 dehydrogenase [Cyanobacteria bacterium UBA11159]HBS69087.1 dehydrogenase [Cyanobacteria bacterium UBA11153]HBW90938.1 dehydrogenase [Cyanobacteria bacterium UBA11149]HCA95068.1 dehydrogenase [Cyanobacteria bacterium UBA9226]
MLAALLYGKEDLRLEEVPNPTPDVGEIVIKVNTATTCGTDLKVWRRGGHARMLKPPTLFGHEVVGEIVSLGEGVTDWQIGDRIVANNSAPCMKCFFCQRREYSLCPDLIFNNGTFAEYLKIPAPIVRHNVLAVPSDLPDSLAAMTEPLACVIHGIAHSNIKEGDRVVVIGDGAIGLMFVAALARLEVESGNHSLPSKIFLFGGNDKRLAIGKKLGASQVFNYHQLSDVPALIKELTDGWGADVVIEATGVPTVWETAIASGRPGATINLFGGCPRDTTITVSTEQIHYNQLTLKGVFHNTPTFVREALSLLASRTIPFELLLTNTRPLIELEQALQDMKTRQAIKVAIQP